MPHSSREKLYSWSKTTGQERKCACFLIDLLFDRPEILNYNLEELISKEKVKMCFIFSFTKKYFRLTDLATVKKAINDKLCHFPGRTREKTPKKSKIKFSESKANADVQEVSSKRSEKSDNENSEFSFDS